MNRCSFFHIKVILLSSLLAFLASCTSSKQIAQDDYFLVQNTYNINTDDRRVRVAEIRENLIELVEQEPVKKGLNPRTWNKKLTVYKRALTIETAEKFEKYLRNSKGFYQAEVNYEERGRDNEMMVKYIIDLNQRSYIDSLSYVFEDPKMQKIYEENSKRRILQVGQALDIANFEKEKARIVKLMKQNGYANFNSNYIEYRADSVSAEIDVQLYVYNPTEQPRHEKFEIGEINVFTEHSRTINPRSEYSDTINQKLYHAYQDEFIVNPAMIDALVTLKPGAVYNKKDEEITNRNLSRLSPYRFAVLDPYFESDSSSIYNYNIFLTPYAHKWYMNSGIDLFYSSINGVSGQNLFGVSGNLSFTNRNYQRKAISHTMGLQGTLEFGLGNNADSVQNFTSNSLQLENRFEIPKVMDIYKFLGVMKRFDLLSDDAFENIKSNGNTVIDFSLRFNDARNLYRRLDVNAAWRYEFQPTEYTRYSFGQLGVEMLYTEVDESFRTRLENNNNNLLLLSFEPYLVTNFFIPEFSIIHTTPETSNGSQFLLIGSFEPSGLESWFLNKVTNGFGLGQNNWRVGSLDFAEFLRFEGDIRYYKKVKNRSSFASRFNVGIGIPFSDSQVLPFNKQFYLGGPNSLRGWQLRELGPGTRVIEGNDGDIPFFQSGDIKLNMSAEYRFDLFWYLESAIFLDAGNIWRFSERGGTEGIGNGVLGANFIEDIAVAAGYSLRIDMDYFLFRLDFGYKVRNPYPVNENGEYDENGTRFVLTNSINNTLGSISFAINYPF